VAEGTYTVTANDGVVPEASVTFLVAVPLPNADVVITDPAEDGAIYAPGTVDVSGTAEPGITIDVTLDGVTNQVEVDADGNWTTTFDDVTVGEQEIVATDGATIDTRDITVTNGVTIDAPADGSTLPAGTVDATGTADPLATVNVTIGDTTNTVTADETGAWTTSFQNIQAGDYTVDASDARYTGTETVWTDSVDFTVVAPVVITSPADGTTLALGTTPVSGTAAPNTVVTLTVNGVDAGTATSDATGNWTPQF
jgi:hypothetical protein